MPGELLAMALALRTPQVMAACCCCICLQTPLQVPWAHFDESDASQPSGPLCYCCGDTCLQRWPNLSTPQIEAKAADGREGPNFRKQVIGLSKVKLGQAAKNFYPQEVRREECGSLRVEMPLVPYTREGFRKEFGGDADVAGVKPTTLKYGKDSLSQWYLVRDDAQTPRVSLCYEHSLKMSELKFDGKSMLEANQGEEVMERVAGGFWSRVTPETIHKASDIRSTLQSQPSGSGGSLVPAARTGTVAAEGLGGPAGRLLALESQAQTPSLRQPPGRQARPPPRRRGSSSPPPSGKRARPGAAGKSEQYEMPSVAQCVLGQGGSVGRTQMQILYTCKQQIDGKYQRGELDFNAHAKQIKRHALRLSASLLAPGTLEKASVVEFEAAWRKVLAEAPAEEVLPQRLFVNTFRKILTDEVTSAAQKGKAANTPHQPWACIKAVTWPIMAEGPLHSAPKSLSQVSELALSPDMRWAVCLDLWLEVALPTYLDDTVPGDDDFLSAARSLLGVAAQHWHIDAARALHESLSFLIIPWQTEPVSQKQLDVFLSMHEPAKASTHIQSVFASLSNAWKEHLRAIMGYALKEAQHEASISSMAEALTQAGNHAETWERLKSALPRWVKQVRPQALDSLFLAAGKNVSMRTVGVPSADAGELRAAWQDAVYLREHAPEKHRSTWDGHIERTHGLWLQATADERWNAWMMKVKAIGEGLTSNVTGESAKQLMDLAKSCDGLPCPATDQASVIAAARHVLKSDVLDEQVLVAPAALMKFIPGAEEQSLRLQAHLAEVAASCVALARKDAASENWIDEVKAALKRHDEVLKSMGGDASVLAAEMGAWPEAQKHIDHLITTLAHAKQGDVDKAMKDCQQQADKLQAIVKGLAWKGNLPERAGWSHIVTEIGYKFWNDSDVIGRLDAAFAASTAAWAAYETVCGAQKVDSKLKEQIEELHQDAMVLNTEEFYVRVLEEKQDGMVRKLSRRQVQINQKFEASLVHEIIRARVTDATGL